MKCSSGLRGTVSDASESLNHQLNMYALAASAAGVGMLALLQPAEAKIVYTPANKVIGLNGSYNLDLNHDGIPDFRIFERVIYSTVYNDNHLSVKPFGRNWVAGNQRIYADALIRDTKVPGSQTFYQRQLGMCQARSGGRRGDFGLWCNVTNRYLGLKFTIKGKIHYGWARLTVTTKYDDIHIKAVLTGYAYETTPGKAILAGVTKGPDDTSALNTHAPEPATLGALALGAPGLSIWRRKESAAAALAAN
jgi:hypothetical protein